MILGSFDLVLTGGSGERGVNTTSLYLIKIHTGVKLSTAHSTIKVSCSSCTIKIVCSIYTLANCIYLATYSNGTNFNALFQVMQIVTPLNVFKGPSET